MILPIFIGGGMAVSDRALARTEVGAACVFILAVVVAISVGVYLGNVPTDVCPRGIRREPVVCPYDMATAAALMSGLWTCIVAMLVTALVFAVRRIFRALRQGVEE